MLADNKLFELILRRHPHIGEKIRALWGSSQCDTFMNDLLNDTRDSARKGFSEEVALALFRLMQEHEEEFPDKPVEERDIWNANNKI
jgi:hypothetical protein